MKYQAAFIHRLHSLCYQNSKLTDDCHQSVGDFQINKKRDNLLAVQQMLQYCVKYI
jgi:hypothetical protein